jgi:hypothetical protein
VYRYERQRRVPLETFDRADSRKCRGLQDREPFHLTPERVFETGHGAERRLKTKELEPLGVAVIEHQQPIAETIRSTRCVPAGQTLRRRGFGWVQICDAIHQLAALKGRCEDSARNDRAVNTITRHRRFFR